MHTGNENEGTQDQLALSVEAFAKAHSISRVKVFALIKAGTIQAVKCGRRTLIPRSESQRFLAGLPKAG